MRRAFPSGPLPARSWLWLLVPVLLPLGFFWRAALGRGIFFDGDVFRHFYAQKVAYVEALKRGTLPLWAPEVAAGYPLYAEGEVGALYPFNLILYTLLPIDLAFNYSFILHYSLAGVGMYLFLRRLALKPPACLLGSFVFAFSGFTIGHLSHLSILSGAVWLPLLMALVDVAQERLARSPASAMAPLAGLSILLALVLLGGHPQISLLTLLCLVAYLLYGAWTRRGQGGFPRLMLGPLLSLALGLGLGAVQLIPTLELMRLSQRGGGLDPDYFTSFSFRPSYLVSLVHPFILGNPYPNVSIELAGYVGIVPLLLVVVALVLRREGRTWFFAGMAAATLWMAFGHWNAVYVRLVSVPVLNLFRVPARFLYLFLFAAAILAALGLDALAERGSSAPGSAPGKIVAGLALAAIAVGGILVECLCSLDRLLAIWQYLPLVLLLAGLGLLAGFWRGHLGWWTFAVPLVGIVLFDLYAHAVVYNRTYNATIAPAEFFARPRWLACTSGGSERCRVYTDEKMLPLFSMRRETLYPNTSLVYGVESANAYLPLLLRPYIRYMENLSPQRLNLLNVEYFLIPQVLPVDEAAEAQDLANPFSPSLAGKRLRIPPTGVLSLELESFLSHAVHLRDGELVAQVVLWGERGEEIRLPVRAGLETAEWAYQREDVRQEIEHQSPPIARTWPARSGYPAREHLGQTYLARYDLAEVASSALKVVGIEVVSHYPVAFMRFERIVLLGSGGEKDILSHLVGESDHLLIYRSEDVAIYRNEDALPRAYVVHRARVIADDEEAVAYLDGPAFSPRSEVILASGEALRAEAQGPESVQMVRYTPTQVVVQAQLSAEGYLVLADSYYPGWQVRVDGRPRELVRANVLFRAVRLPAGEHQVEFIFRPRSLYLGLAISLACLILLAAAWGGKIRSNGLKLKARGIS